MSAYQCSPEHIAFICAVYSEVWHNRRTDYMTHVPTSDLYAILSTENAESVAFRYREPVAAYPAVLAYPRLDIATIDANIGAIFRSIACLEYQSCERDDWEKSNACQLLKGLREALISRLPGADMDGAWGLPALVPVAVAAPSVCASHVHQLPTFGGIFIARPVGGSRCVTEIPNEPDDAQRWVMLVAKSREDCQHISGAVAFATLAACC